MSVRKFFFNYRKKNQVKSEQSQPDLETNTPYLLFNGNSSLAQGMRFLNNAIEARLNYYFKRTTTFQAPAFGFSDDGSAFAQFIIENKLKIEEYLLLMLALAPHIHPDLFSELIKRYLPQGGDFPEFGGVKGTQYRGILPTGETALFLLAGMNLDQRLAIHQWIQSRTSILFTEQVIALELPKQQEPINSGKLTISTEKLSEFLIGQKWRPHFSTDFPAALLETNMEWNDLVLSPLIHQELAKIEGWLNYQEKLKQDPHLGVRIKPGFRVLFHGAPGTGKTLTASLLGKSYCKDVFRVDLSMVVSKYIGETEKNLQKVFDTAANKNWILFFDECDALFGKRTNVQSSHDRFANQEVSYLLQKIEEHPGLIILASNFKNNMDLAFMRRFQVVVHFSMPTAEERLIIWKKTLPTTIQLADEVDVVNLANKYELSGAAILNVIHAASIQALTTGKAINNQLLLGGIRKEFSKLGKTL